MPEIGLITALARFGIPDICGCPPPPDKKRKLFRRAYSGCAHIVGAPCVPSSARAIIHPRRVASQCPCHHATPSEPTCRYRAVHPDGMHGTRSRRQP